MGSGCVVVGMYIVLVVLWVNEQVFLFEIDQGIVNGSIFVWVVLYGLFDDVGDFVVMFVVYFLYSVEYLLLYGF